MMATCQNDGNNPFSNDLETKDGSSNEGEFIGEFCYRSGVIIKIWSVMM